MCCCNGNNSVSSCGCGCGSICGCSGSSGWGCGCGSSGGAATLPVFPDLSVCSGAASAANTRWPVYISYPAFLYDAAIEADSCGCGSCCG